MTPSEDSIVKTLLAATDSGNDDLLDDQVRRLLEDGRVSVIEYGALIGFDESGVDIDDPDAFEVLDGHVTPARLQRLSDGARLTKKERRLWIELVSEDIFNQDCDVWKVGEVSDAGGASAYLALVYPLMGGAVRVLGAYATEDEAREAIADEGYVDVDDLLARHPATGAPSRPAAPARPTVDLPASGYTEAFDHARVCGVCFHLFEQGRPDGHNQQCACAGAPSDPWPGHDVNEHVRLCGSCGVTVLRSGSRWSPFFCPQCQTFAMAATMLAGRLVFPIGRHSIMHLWVPGTRTPSLAAHGGDGDALAASVAAAIAPIDDGLTVVEGWTAWQVKDNVSRLALGHGVSLREYLIAVLGDQPVDKLQAFGRLCAFAREQRHG